MTRSVRQVAAALTAVALSAATGTTGYAAAPEEAGEQFTSGPQSVPQEQILATELAEQLAAAAEEAGELQRRLSTSEAAGPTPEIGTGFPFDDSEGPLLDLLVDGAIGVTARLETPTTTWQSAAGHRVIDHELATHPQDRFRVASNTKPMIAALVMQEVVAGTWTLETAVADILPGVLPAGVTIEHLLSHRSGLPDHVASMIAMRMEDPESMEEFIEVLGQDFTDADHLAAIDTLPFLFEPGTDFTYSNAGYVLLGMMLESVTGRDLDALLNERIFRPAGMRHSDYPQRSGTEGPFLEGAAFTDEGWYGLGHFNPRVFDASGAITSTTEDLSSFAEALASGEIVPAETVDDMFEPRSDSVMEYGLGVYRVPDPCVPGEYLYGHDGATFGTLSIMLTSADGARQLTFGINGRNVSADPEALYDVNDLLVPMLLASCA